MNEFQKVVFLFAGEKPPRATYCRHRKWGNDGGQRRTGCVRIHDLVGLEMNAIFSRIQKDKSSRRGHGGGQELRVERARRAENRMIAISYDLAFSHQKNSSHP
jgi:hypothetical protein